MPTLAELDLKEYPKSLSVFIIGFMVAIAGIYWLYQDVLPLYMVFLGLIINVACVYALSKISLQQLVAFKVGQIKKMTVGEFKDEYEDTLNLSHNKAMSRAYNHYRKVIFYVFLKSYGEDKSDFINKITNDSQVNAYIEIEAYIIDSFMGNKSLDDVLLKELLV